MPVAATTSVNSTCRYPFFINFAGCKSFKTRINMLSMHRRKEIINYYITFGYGAKKIRSVMLSEGKQAPSRNTIRKYLNHYKEILSTKGRKAAEDFVRNGERFRTPERHRTKLDAEACDFIEFWIDSNEKEKNTHMRKHHAGMLKVWRTLHDEMGYDISYSSVTAYAREYRAREYGPKKSRECFIKQYHPAGEECQFDWGDVRLSIHGHSLKLRMAAFVLPHSNHRRGYLFLCENTLAFQEAHRNYFHDIGHIPVRMVYDNMKVAVKSFVGTEKEPTDALLDLSNHYSFKWRFCNIRSGNEKGNVEETVKVLRSEAFSMKREFDSIEDAQRWLDKVCGEMNRKGLSPATADVAKLAEEDFAAMRPCTEDFGCFRQEQRKVNNLGFITVGNAFYSVPDRLVGETVDVRNYTNKIEVLYGGDTVATHEKVRPGKSRIVLWHYLKTLGYKPGALRNAEALRQAPDAIRRVFEASFSENPKDFVVLLVETRDAGMGYADIIRAYGRLRSCNVKAGNITLRLMETVLFGRNEPDDPEKAMSMLQDGNAIETNAERGLASLTVLMSGTVSKGGGYAGNRG